MNSKKRMNRATASRVVAVIALVWQFPLYAQEALPSDVKNFIEQRTLCDHFREEPWPEGDTAGECERREFLLAQTKRYCTGTDARLRALRARYRDDREVLQRLSTFESAIELK